MKFTTAVLAATLIAEGAALYATPAGAQSPLESLRRQQRGQREEPRPQPQPQQQQSARVQSLSREENAAIMPAYQAVQALDWAAASAALPAAQAGAQSPYARYVVGQLTLEIGRGTQSLPMQSQAVDAMIASGGAPAEALGPLLAAQIAFALDANNFAVAESSLTRFIEANPNDTARVIQLAQVKNRLNKKQEALTLYRRAIQLTEAGGQRASEDQYRGALAIAYEGRMAEPALELSRTLVTYYPTPANWRSALGVYRELGGSQEGMRIDLSRLMRAAGALGSERDYYEYAEAANRAGLPGEAKAVLDEGLGRNMFTTGIGAARTLLGLATARVAEDRAAMAGLRTRALAGGSGRDARTTGDVYFGYAQYAEAAALYRAALEKGGEDANLVNTRLGAALALAGQRADAETAFRAITGPRADLARFWLLWLSTRT